jgi:nucleoside permease NupC
VRKTESQTTYFFVFAGFAWLYGVSSHRARWFPTSLREDGSLMVLSMPFNEYLSMTDFNRMLGEALFGKLPT